MTRCVCGHVSREHERNPARPGYGACTVPKCACAAYEWHDERRGEEDDEPQQEPDDEKPPQGRRR